MGVERDRLGRQRRRPDLRGLPHRSRRGARQRDFRDRSAASAGGIKAPYSSAADLMGHRTDLTPRFRLEQVRAPRDNVLGGAGGACNWWR